MKKYDDFINEGLADFGLIDLITDLIMSNMPLSKIKELKKDLQSTNEGLLSDLSEKFDKWLSKKAVDYLVKSTDKYYNKQLEIVNMFDPTDFTDIDKCEFIYLGGGIDAVVDLKHNWRYWFEEQFSTEEVNPHVLYSEDAIKMSLSGSWKGIDKDNFAKPYIFNPLRNEIIRDDPEFQDAYKSFKDGDFDEPFTKDDEKVKRLGKFFNKNVVAFDLRAFTLCDTNFVKWDATAGSGTKGELQLSMNVKQNIFMWVDSKMDRKDVRLKVKHISPWTLGSVTKIVRGDEEVIMLIDSIKKMNGM
jgi:hypothetical protein